MDVITKKRGEADSEEAWSEAGAKPQTPAWVWILPEPQRKRPSILAASQRDNREALSNMISGGERK